MPAAPIRSIVHRRPRDLEFDDGPSPAATQPAPGAMVRDLETPRSGFDRYAEQALNNAGGRQTKGGSRRGFVYTSGPFRGKTKGQAYEMARAQYAKMPDAQRQRWESGALGRDVQSGRELEREERHYAARDIAAGHSGAGAPPQASRTPNAAAPAGAASPAPATSAPQASAQPQPGRSAVASPGLGTINGRPVEEIRAESQTRQARANEEIAATLGRAKARYAPTPASPVEKPPAPFGGFTTAGAQAAAGRYKEEAKDRFGVEFSDPPSEPRSGPEQPNAPAPKAVGAEATAEPSPPSKPAAPPAPEIEAPRQPAETQPMKRELPRPPDGKEVLGRAVNAMTPGIAEGSTIRSDRGQAFGEGVKKAASGFLAWNQNRTSQPLGYDRRVAERTPAPEVAPPPTNHGPGGSPVFSGFREGSSIRSDRGRAFGEGVKHVASSVLEWNKNRTSQPGGFDRKVAEEEERKRRAAAAQARSIE